MKMVYILYVQVSSLRVMTHDKKVIEFALIVLMGHILL